MMKIYYGIPGACSTILISKSGACSTSLIVKSGACSTILISKSGACSTSLIVKSGACSTNCHSPHLPAVYSRTLTSKSAECSMIFTSKSAEDVITFTRPYKGIPLQVQLSLLKVGFRKEFSTSKRLSGSAA